MPASSHLRPFHIAATIVALLLCPTWACAQTWVFKDWAVTCDNTRDCEAVGFQAEHSGSAPVALWVARDAGRGGNIRGRVNVQSPAQPAGGHMRLVMDDGTAVEQEDGEDLAAAPLRKLLPHLLEGTSVDVFRGKERFVLSLDGFKAAMLKVDDLQGRIGTPGALVRKGTRSEAGVPPELPAPVAHPAVAYENKSTDGALLQVLSPKIGSTCPLHASSALDAPDIKLHRVSASQVILLRECERRAFESGYAAWLVDDKPPYAARRLTFPQVDGEPTDLAADAQFDEDELRSIGKKDAGDHCGDDAFWAWTGKAFELTSAHAAPLCRGFDGGGFAISTWQTRESK
jgi:hypothetical protein